MTPVACFQITDKGREVLKIRKADMERMRANKASLEDQDFSEGESVERRKSALDIAKEVEAIVTHSRKANPNSVFDLGRVVELPTAKVIFNRKVSQIVLTESKRRLLEILGKDGGYIPKSKLAELMVVSLATVYTYLHDLKLMELVESADNLIRRDGKNPEWTYRITELGQEYLKEEACTS